MLGDNLDHELGVHLATALPSLITVPCFAFTNLNGKFNLLLTNLPLYSRIVAYFKRFCTAKETTDKMKRQPN